jgi:hypothetical protein
LNFRDLDLDAEQVADLQSLIEKTPALRGLRREPGAAPMDRALRCLSLVRLFDSTLYLGVMIANDSELPPFEAVIHHPDVQPVPRGEQQYWLREAAQTRRLAEWQDHPDDERKWSQWLYLWLTAHGSAAVDCLDLLLRFDSEDALTLLRREYDSADADNDLVRCHALAERVEASMGRIPEGQRGAFLQFVTRYSARALFLTELHLTMKYFPRPEVEKAFDELVSGNGNQWILFLDAPGGMGKTTFIQRMIAHKLLNHPPFSLVVRVDLDDIDVSSIALAPWLIAIEIVSDLEVQLPSKLFSQGNPSFAQQVEPFRPLLYRRTSSRAPALGDNARNELAKQARAEFSQWSKFQSYCRDLPSERPLVVFIDTVEEASLHFPDEFRKVLERFEELHQALPQLRLVLSGRYRPEENHFTSYDKKLRQQTRFATLKPLDPPDARAFIGRVMTRPPSADLIELMVESAGGNPFKLYLLSEIVTDQPSISAQELRESGKDTDIAYLLYRVINRIPAGTELGLRWLLRYGAVPRRLTYSFLEENLHPLLIRALKGELEQDNEDIPSERERQSWLQRAEVDLSPRSLWDKLSKYSSEHGWISVDSHDPDTVILHAEVAKPMRRLLKEQRARGGGKIYTTLNTEAAEHFAKLKKEHPERWVDYALGELFHRIEAGTDDPVQAVKDAFNERPSPGEARLRQGLAVEIVKTDGDFSSAPSAVRAWAFYEYADALVIGHNFRYLPTDERRQELSRLLAQACDLARNTNIALPTLVWRWREFLDSNYPDVRGAIFAMLGLRSEDRSRYWLLLIDLFGQEKLGGGLLSFLRVMISAFPGAVKSARIPSWVWRERYAASLIELGRYTGAINILNDPLTLRPKSLTTADQDRIRARVIKALVLSLRLNEAEHELEKFPLDPALADEKLFQTANIQLLRRDAWGALASVGQVANPSDYRANLFRGMAAGQLLRVAEASSAFDSAAEAANAMGQQHKVDRVELERSRFRLFEANHSTETLTARSVEARGGSALIQAELELCRAWQLRKENPTAAAAIVQALSTGNYSSLIRARAMLAALSWGTLPTESHGELCRVLRGIDGYGARLNLTAPPVEFGDQLEIGSSVATELSSLLTPVSDESGANLARLYAAKVLQAIGRKKSAASFFRKIKALENLSPPELAMLRLCRIADRSIDGDPDPSHLWDPLRNERGLYLAVMVECAERALAMKDLERAADALALSPSEPGLDRLLPAFSLRRIALEKELGSLPMQTRLAPAPTEATPGHPCLLLGVQSQRLFAVLPGQSQPLFISTVENDALAVLTAYTNERTPRRLVELMRKDWDRSISDLREPFVETSLLDDTAGELDRFLILTAPQLVAAPWELALPDRSSVVRIGSGEEGDPFANEMLGSGMPALHIATAALGDLSSVTLFSAEPSNDLKSWEGTQSLNWMNGIQRADVIYVVGPMYPPRRGGPTLGPSLSAEVLSHRIAEACAPQTPCVVLYVPAEGSLSSAVEQLLLRNQFAQALVNTGAVSCVLATGWKNAAGVMEALTHAGSLFDVLQLLRERGEVPADPLATLARKGSAMFVAVARSTL